MIPIYLKLIITILIALFFAYLAAFPDTKFAEWGSRVFKDYGTFLMVLISVFMTPIAIIALIWIWNS